MSVSLLVKACVDCALPKKPVIVIQGNESYPSLFFSMFLYTMRGKAYEIQTIALGEQDWNTVEITTQTSFLGQSRWLWLGDISTLDATLSKKVKNLFDTYQGPHTLFAYATFKDKPVYQETATIAVYTFAPLLEKKDLQVLFTYFFMISSDRVTSLISSLPKITGLDTAMMLGMYFSVLGARTEEFMTQWYPKLVTEEQSLFILAQHFFARKGDLFFKQWLSIKDSYPVQFWTTFWSEQLWRAYQVIAMRNAQEWNDAKQMGFRLPFSFLQRDWQTIQLQELLKAHEFLYKIDSASKLGGQGFGLELLYTRFLQKEWC